MNNPLNELPSDQEKRRKDMMERDMRNTALANAVRIHCDGKTTPDENVVTTARKYYKFLKGDKS